MRRDALNGGGRAHPASEGLTEKLAALADLDAVGLRAEWRRLYRSHPPRHIRRELLVLAIAWKLQEKVHGGLTAAQKRRLAGTGEGAPEERKLVHRPCDPPETRLEAGA